MIALQVLVVIVVVLGLSWYIADDERRCENLVEQWRELIRKSEERGAGAVTLEGLRIDLAGSERTLRWCRTIGAPWKFIARVFGGSR